MASRRQPEGRLGREIHLGNLRLLNYLAVFCSWLW